jgi:hypothetical protein
MKSLLLDVVWCETEFTWLLRRVSWRLAPDTQRNSIMTSMALGDLLKKYQNISPFLSEIDQKPIFENVSD